MNEQQQGNTEAPADPAAALKEAMAKEHTVTSWISVDVQELRTRAPDAAAEIVVQAGRMIQEQLVKELRKHGIVISGRQLRHARRSA